MCCREFRVNAVEVISCDIRDHLQLARIEIVRSGSTERTGVRISERSGVSRVMRKVRMSETPENSVPAVFSIHRLPQCFAFHFNVPGNVGSDRVNSFPQRHSAAQRLVQFPQL